MSLLQFRPVLVRVVLLNFALFFGCAQAEQPKTPELFTAPIDLGLAKAGEWVEYSCEWSCGTQVRKYVERLACVKATEQEVWIEWTGASGITELYRVERAARRVKAAWRKERDGTVNPMQVIPPPVGASPMKTTAKVTSATTESVEATVTEKKLTARRYVIEADLTRGKKTRRYKLDLVLSKDVPLPIPDGGDSRLSTPISELGDVSPWVAWKTPEKLQGSVIEYSLSISDPTGADLTVTQKGSLFRFGGDASATVLVAEEAPK